MNWIALFNNVNKEQDGIKVNAVVVVAVVPYVVAVVLDEIGCFIVVNVLLLSLWYLKF